MATCESYSSLFSMESKERSELSCCGVPLPYLIRPRRTLPSFDTFALYNDYACDSDNESDEDVSAMEEDCAVSDDEYVIVNNVDDMPDSEKERVGAIHMMELCKDVPESPKASDAKDVPESPMASDAVSEKDTTVDESKSDDEGSSGDEWVVV